MTQVFKNVLDCDYLPVGDSLCRSIMDFLSKCILYVFSYPIQLNNMTTNVPARTSDKNLRRHSVLFQSSSESEGEIVQQELFENEDLNVENFFPAFKNKYPQKDSVARVARLKSYREDSVLQNLAQVIFDYSLDDADRFISLFTNEGNIKKIW